MIKRKWLNRTVVSIGEAMVEFAPVGDNLYRRGFAGDTLNTAWHLAKLLGLSGRVSYLTRVGEEAFSAEFLAFLAASGLGAAEVARDPERTMGLYVISLVGAERSFSYWRDSSAARRLADDEGRLDAALNGVGLIHFSGITLAVIGENSRGNLLRALARARLGGSVVSFDPNVRPRLWPDPDEMKRAMREAFTVADIALPSFDDETRVWGDADPEKTARRIAALGASEIAVKNGDQPMALMSDNQVSLAPTPLMADIRDTTGAGDAFNAGYLAGRLAGSPIIEACRLGQEVACEVIRHFGALAPEEALARFRVHAEV